MEKEPKIEKKPTLKYEKPVLIDLTPKRAFGADVCLPMGSSPLNGIDPPLTPP